MPQLISTSDTRYAAIADVASQVGTRPEWLSRQIAFESGYDPLIKNPNSSARGLIQLTDIAAKELGYSSSENAIAKYPGFELQMYGIVKPYLQSVADRFPNPTDPADPFPTEISQYMGIFLPAYRFRTVDTVLPQWVQAANPGIRTIQNYVDLLYGKSSGRPSGRPVGSPVPMIAMAAVAAFILWKALTPRRGYVVRRAGALI